MVKKKRPSLKNYLATGQVLPDETALEPKSESIAGAEPAPVSEEADASPQVEGAPVPRKKSPRKVQRKKSPAKNKSGDIRETPSNTCPVHAGNTDSVPQPPCPEGKTGEEASRLLDMLCEEDMKTWGKIFADADVEFLPLDFIERREDFRTMDRSRFTLFRLDGEGTSLFHVRTSVQIREPLVALLKWDETGRVSVYRL
jgi:hypothetical protein